MTSGQLDWVITNLLIDQDQMRQVMDAEEGNGGRTVYSALGV